MKNDQRKAIFEQRVEFMSAESVEEIIAEMREQLVDDTVGQFIPPKSYAEQWDVEGLANELDEVFGKPFRVKQWASEEGVADTEIIERLSEDSGKLLQSRESDVGIDTMRSLEKAILLHVLDTNWREHLQQLDHLQSVVGLRGYGQRDPINEFKTEAFALFENLLNTLRRDVIKMICHVEVRAPEQSMPEERDIPMTESHANPHTGENQLDASPRRATASAGVGTIRARRSGEEIDPTNPATWGRVPRNAPCPCGSGKKYKHCHGAI